MKQLLTLMGFLGLCTPGLFGQILYVSEGANGNGESWDSPIGSLHTALYLAEPGTQIWVAKGTYLPSNCENCTPNDRKISFTIPSGVKIYGGFAGHEASIEERKWRSNASQLSGDIGRGGLFDNSHTVVRFENVSTETLLDGFFIAHGYADEKGRPGNPHRSGAGVFNSATLPGESSEPTISNCVFMENFAYEGGAIYNLGRPGNAIVHLEGCAFVKNEGFLAGGAVFDDNPNGGMVSQISNSRLVGNEAVFGGAYFCSKVRGEGLVFQGCQFIANESKAGAAGFALMGEREEGADIFHEDCFFKNNSSQAGEDFFLQKGKEIPDTMKGIAAGETWSDL